MPQTEQPRKVRIVGEKFAGVHAILVCHECSEVLSAWSRTLSELEDRVKGLGWRDWRTARRLVCPSCVQRQLDYTPSLLPELGH